MRVEASGWVRRVGFPGRPRATRSEKMLTDSVQQLMAVQRSWVGTSARLVVGRRSGHPKRAFIAKGKREIHLLACHRPYTYLRVDTQCFSDSARAYAS